MYCIKCGTRLSDDSLFCHACGAKVVRDLPPQAQEKQEATINIPPEPVNISNSVNKEEPQEETKGGWTTRLWQAFAIIAFIIAGGIGKALGKEAYKHFPFIFGMITGSIIVSLIPYFLVKKYGKWDNNDTMSWIFATVCFVAHMVAGLFFSVPLVLVMAFIIYIKHK